MAPRYVPPHKRGARRAAAAGGDMEPEEEIAEAAIGEQRRLGTARRVSARTKMTPDEGLHYGPHATYLLVLRLA